LKKIRILHFVVLTLFNQQNSQTAKGCEIFPLAVHSTHRIPIYMYFMRKRAKIKEKDISLHH